MRELLLVRHGESLGNAAAAAAELAAAEVIDMPAADADLALSATGVKQSLAFGRALAAVEAARQPTAVACSPYVRARESLEIALNAAGLRLPTSVDERLRDREIGVLEGLTERGVAARHPEEIERRERIGAFYHRPPGGESLADVGMRVRSFLSDVDRPGDDGRLLVMCHDSVVMLFRFVCESLTEAEMRRIAVEGPIRNLSVTHLARERDASPWRVLAYNDVSHLERAGVPVTPVARER